MCHLKSRYFGWIRRGRRRHSHFFDIDVRDRSCERRMPQRNFRASCTIFHSQGVRISCATRTCMRPTGPWSLLPGRSGPSRCPPVRRPYPSRLDARPGGPTGTFGWQGRSASHLVAVVMTLFRTPSMQRVAESHHFLVLCSGRPGETARGPGFRIANHIRSGRLVQSWPQPLPLHCPWMIATSITTETGPRWMAPDSLRSPTPTGNSNFRR
jgi:hypothetical protein